MAQTVVILGRGKLATALEHVFSSQFDTLTLARPTFDAGQPKSVDTALMTCNPRYIFNTVVLGGVDACAASPAEALGVNTLFPMHIAGLAAQLNATLIHFSTDSVFSDEQGQAPHTESSATMPPNMYGYTKFGADTLIPRRTQNYVIYRLPVLFGPSPGNHQFFERMAAMLPAGKPLKIAADIFSHAVYSLDVAKTIMTHLTTSPQPGVYHMAGNERGSLHELMCIAAEVLGYSASKIQKACAADFPGLDYKNRHIHLASEKIPALRSWRESLPEFCRTFFMRKDAPSTSREN